ncbi:MAG: antibiotic biosynthesis monooxygenase [Cytophagales bacterium]|nr:antibiotic biosynthesis monooxygenase [Cytophagales bacterium]
MNEFFFLQVPGVISALLLMTLVSPGESNAQEIDPGVLSEPIVSQVSDPSQPFSVLIDITLIPGQEAAFEKAFAPVIAEVRKEPGNIEFQLSRHPEEPNVYFLYERWKNVQVLKEHMVTPHMSQFWPQYFPMIARIPTIRVYMERDLQ